MFSSKGMKFWLWILLPIFIYAQETSDLESQFKYQALIIELTGEARIYRQGQKSGIPVQWGSYIYQGDTVRTGEKSRIKLLFHDGDMIVLGNNSEMAIDTHAGKDPQKATTAANEKGKAIPILDSLISISHLMSKKKIVSTPGGDLMITSEMRSTCEDSFMLYPRNHVIDNLQPTFKWTSSVENASYKLTLFHNNQKIKEVTTKSTEIKCPVKLEWGKTYQLKFEISRDLRPLSSGLVTFFSVMTREDYEQYRQILKELAALQAKKPNDDYYHFLLATTYKKYLLLDKAINEFQILAEKNPTQLFPNEALTALYLNLKLVNQSEKYLKIVNKLSKEQKI